MYYRFRSVASSITNREMGRNSCVPVIRIDGTEDWRMNATNIAERFYDKNGFIKTTMSI